MIRPYISSIAAVPKDGMESLTESCSRTWRLPGISGGTSIYRPIRPKVFLNQPQMDP